MSLITKISKLFAKSEPKHQLGIAFRQDALAFCFSSDQGQFQYQQTPIVKGEQLAALEQMLSGDDLASQGHLILAPNQYQIVAIDKPEVPEEELLGALKWQVKELVSISPDDMIVDYFSGPTLSGGSEKINVVCAQKSELKKIVEMFDDSAVYLKSIATEEFAFASLVPFQEQATMLVCQQPNEEVLILIVKHGCIYFHRRLRGYTQLASKSMEELTFGTIDSLSLEIQRSSDYFERQLKQAPIREIQLVLPIKTQEFIATKLAENTNTSVQVFEFKEEHKDKTMYATAIGATLLNKMEVKANA